MLLTNNPDGILPSGTTPTIGAGGNSGGVSGSFWDVITLPSGGSIVSDSGQALRALSYLITIGITAAEAYLSWTTSLGSLAALNSRAYCYLTVNPGTAFKLIRTLTTGSANASVIVNTAGTISTLNAAGTVIATSTNTVPLNQWFRIEFDTTASATVGVLTARMYKTANAVSPTETLNSTAQNTGAGPMNTIRFGPTGTTIASVTLRLGGLGVTDQGPMGPISSNPSQPGGAAQDQAINRTLYW